MEKLTKEQEIIKLLFKDFLTFYNSRSISKVIKMSHPGAFKIMKRLEKRKIVSPKTIGKAVIYSLNLDNPVSIREIEMALTLEGESYNRWIEEFKELNKKAEFIVLFGSIIKNEKEARDIDLIVVADKSNFNYLKNIISKRNNLSNKKIHLIIQPPEDFKKDLISKNKAIIEIIKTGIVLYGQENLTKILGQYLKNE